MRISDWSSDVCSSDLFQAAQVEVDRVAEQHQLHHRDAQDHRQRHAVAAQLAHLLDHDREHAAQVHAGSAVRSRSSSALPPVAATNTSSRFGVDASTPACSPASSSTPRMPAAAAPLRSVSTRRMLPIWATLSTPGTSHRAFCACRGSAASTSTVRPSSAVVSSSGVPSRSEEHTSELQSEEHTSELQSLMRDSY